MMNNRVFFSVRVFDFKFHSFLGIYGLVISDVGGHR